jgi:syntaxin-binding protein 5
MQFEPHRVAVTRNADLTIRFLDISVQLLIPTPPSPFTSAFPRPLPLLSIDIFALASFPEVAAHLPSNFAEQARIDDVQLAIESLEVGIVLGGGEVLVYRMADRQGATARQLPDKRLVSLEHVPVNDGLRVKPYFLVKAESPVTAFAISDVGEHPGHVDRPFCLLVSPGFASVAYTNGLLIVIDMRSPRVILEVGKAQQTSQRHSLIHRHSPGVDPVFSLAWTISGVKSGKSPL